MCVFQCLSVAFGWMREVFGCILAILEICRELVSTHVVVSGALSLPGCGVWGESC